MPNPIKPETDRLASQGDAGRVGDAARVCGSGDAGRRVFATTPEVDALLHAGAAVAIGVSGGKDSQAAALAVAAYLSEIGHAGPRVLVHSDLGMVEWKSSLTVCENLAQHLGLELIVTRRKAGGLMERWESRWASSVRRYTELETVTLVLPWSTPSMRFCTSELKTHVITAELKRRFRGLPIINVTGVRREESAARAKQSVASIDAVNSKPGAPFMNWRPIIEHKVGEVFASIAEAGLQPHEAYTKWGSSRVSCCFCIMSSIADMAAAASNPENHDLYRRMVALELDSTFAFQGARWLCDVMPDLLDAVSRERVADSKNRGAQRVAAEAIIPKALLYVKGWPTFIPSHEQANLIASVRREVAYQMRLSVNYTKATAVRERYAELFNARQRAIPAIAEAA